MQATKEHWLSRARLLYVVSGSSGRRPCRSVLDLHPAGRYGTVQARLCPLRRDDDQRRIRDGSDGDVHQGEHENALRDLPEAPDPHIGLKRDDRDEHGEPQEQPRRTETEESREWSSDTRHDHAHCRKPAVAAESEVRVAGSRGEQCLTGEHGKCAGRHGPHDGYRSRDEKPPPRRLSRSEGKADAEPTREWPGAAASRVTCDMRSPFPWRYSNEFEPTV